MVFQTDAGKFLRDPSLGEELFGPSTLLINYSTREQLLQKADAFGLGERLRAALAASGDLAFQRWEPIEVDPDQVATDLRMFCRDAILAELEALLAIQRALLVVA